MWAIIQIQIITCFILLFLQDKGRPTTFRPPRRAQGLFHNTFSWTSFTFGTNLYQSTPNPLSSFHFSFCVYVGHAIYTNTVYTNWFILLSNFNPVVLTTVIYHISGCLGDIYSSITWYWRWKNEASAIQTWQPGSTWGWWVGS